MGVETFIGFEPVDELGKGRLLHDSDFNDRGLFFDFLFAGKKENSANEKRRDE